jgi:pimeloyl-ACP methyl ester carboxylesterase
MIQLNFKSFGEGRPIIFLHGLFGMLDNWQTFGKKMADNDYKVYLIDQRDHGKSPTTEAFNYKLLAADLKDFIVDQGLDSAIIVGHSMGGKTAMQFVAGWPYLVDKLIIVDIAPKEYSNGHQAIFDALLDYDLKTIQSRKEIYEYLKSKLNDESTIQFLLKNMNRLPEGGYQLKMNLELLYKEYSNIISNVEIKDIVKVPTLFIKGELSHYITKADEMEINRLFANVEIIEIPNASHWVHADKPQELYDVFTNFLGIDK